MSEARARYVGGIVTTASLLVAQHFFPWWRPLPKLTAYILGVAAILLGQGVWMRFDLRWRKLCSFAAAGGAVVTGSYLYDWLARKKVNENVLALVIAILARKPIADEVGGNDGLSKESISHET